MASISDYLIVQATRLFCKMNDANKKAELT